MTVTEWIVVGCFWALVVVGVAAVVAKIHSEGL